MNSEEKQAPFMRAQMNQNKNSVMMTRCHPTTSHFKAMKACSILHTWEVAGMCQGVCMQFHTFPTKD